MKNRHESREIALQCLYLIDVSKQDALEACQSVFTEHMSSEMRLLCRHWIEGVCQQKETLDELLQKTATNWDMKRMAVIDRNILRLAMYEILNDKETPIAVILDEAIELAKKFSTQDSGKFVNGLLDKLKKHRAD